jgi:hypothetical protein
MQTQLALGYLLKTIHHHTYTQCWRNRFALVNIARVMLIFDLPLSLMHSYTAQ